MIKIDIKKIEEIRKEVKVEAKEEEVKEVEAGAEVEVEVEVEIKIKIEIIIIEEEAQGQKKLIYALIVAKKGIGLMNAIIQEKKGK